MPDNLTPPFFDTHAHYDHPMFSGTGTSVLENLFKTGVLNGVVIPAITWESNYHRDLFPEDRFPNCFFAAGIHPKAVTNEKWFDGEKKTAFSGLLQDPRTVAVKTGLDFCKKRLTQAQKHHQIRFLRYFIEEAEAMGLALVFHLRDAMEELLEVLRESPLKTAAEVHCFTGDITTAEKLMDAGVTHFGIGGMLTRKEFGHLRDCVKNLPPETILLETDAPFVKPAGYTGKLNDSSTLMYIAGVLAKFLGVETADIASLTEKNAKEFFRLTDRGRKTGFSA